MCRERILYTTDEDPYCRFIKKFFNEKGLDYKEVDISRDEKEFYELLNFYGTGPLPVLVEDGKIVPLNQLVQNAHWTFLGYAKNNEHASNRVLYATLRAPEEYE